MAEFKKYINDPEKRIKFQTIAMFLLSVGIFIILYYIREQFVVSILHTERTYLWAVNYMAFAGMFILFVFAKPDISLKRISSVILFVLPALAAIPMGLSLYFHEVGLGAILINIIIIICPLFIIYLEIDNEVIEKWAPVFLILIHVILFIMAIHGSIDMLAHKAINKWLAGFMTHPKYFEQYALAKGEDTRRFFSMYGTQLHTAYIANVFFTINLIARQKKFKYSLPILIEAVPVLVIHACTASRAAIVVFGVIFILAVYKNVKLMIAGAVGVVILYFAGVFNLLIERFTTFSLIKAGRTRSLFKFFAKSEYPLKFFIGYGDPSVGNTWNKFVAAMEFPAIIGSFQFGILFSILFLCIPVIYVIKRMWKKNCIVYLIMWLLLYMQTNTYAQLIQGVDHPWVTWFTTLIIISFSLYENKKENQTNDISSNTDI